MATGKSKGYGFVSFFNKWVSVPIMTVLEESETGSDFSVRDKISVLYLVMFTNVLFFFFCACFV